jgi:tetratricopeptide (TPR) repeat protein
MTEAGGRLAKLLEMLEKQPADAFLLYGAAMEYKKAGDYPKAIEYLERVLRVDPGYCYAYFQRGQVYEASGDVEAAKRAYGEGIEAAVKKGDAHARDEIEAALAMIA